jgi:tripeptide aminopeptidase
VVNGGYWENANPGILGADNKSAVAVALELARRLKAGEEPPPVGLELLFTVCEEVSLRGSAAFDVSSLKSSFGYVFDHATPIGEVVVSSPTHYRIVAEFRGHAAHAGVRPETGRSAVVAAAAAIAKLRLGRLDAETTANVGLIDGGTAINVVPERCRVEAEVRSLDAERAAAVTTETIDRLQDAANAHECDLDVDVAQMFKGYRTKPRAPQLQAAERALRVCGYEPRPIPSGGASDANSFEAQGFSCTCLADGTERNHEPGERIGVAALESLFDVAIALVDEAAVELGVAHE